MECRGRCRFVRGISNSFSRFDAPRCGRDCYDCFHLFSPPWGAVVPLIKASVPFNATTTPLRPATTCCHLDLGPSLKTALPLLQEEHAPPAIISILPPIFYLLSSRCSSSESVPGDPTNLTCHAASTDTSPPIMHPQPPPSRPPVSPR